MSRLMACRALFLLALGLFAVAVRAEPVGGLYEAEVPVASQDEQARAAAAEAALRIVLLKVAGSRSALDNPAVAAALPNAVNYLAQFYYTSLSYPPREAGPAAEPGLHVVFPPRSVDAILRRAGEPVLPPNRPATLLWLAIDDGTGQRLMTRDADTVLVDWLGFHAARRGMPLLFPQMDLEDTAAVTPEQLWTLDTEVPLRAAQRYATPSVLLGRLTRASDGSWLGEWRHVLAGQSSDGQGSAATLDLLAEQLAGFAGDAVAAHYAVKAADAGTTQLRLQVGGVSGFAAYQQLSGLLKAMTSVRDLQLTLVDRDTFYFELLTNTSFETVVRELSLLSQLQSEGAEGELRYRWVGG